MKITNITNTTKFIISYDQLHNSFPDLNEDELYLKLHSILSGCKHTIETLGPFSQFGLYFSLKNIYASLNIYNPDLKYDNIIWRNGDKFEYHVQTLNGKSNQYIFTLTKIYGGNNHDN